MKKHWTIPKSVGIVRANKPECLHGTLWLDVKDATRLTSEASDLVNQPPGGFADQDPHALPVSLDLPRDVRGLRHDAVVRNLRPSNNTNSGATKQSRINHNVCNRYFHGYGNGKGIKLQVLGME